MWLVVNKCGDEGECGSDKCKCSDDGGDGDDSKCGDQGTMVGGASGW